MKITSPRQICRLKDSFLRANGIRTEIDTDQGLQTDNDSRLKSMDRIMYYHLLINTV